MRRRPFPRLPPSLLLPFPLSPSAHASHYENILHSRNVSPSRDRPRNEGLRRRRRVPDPRRRGCHLRLPRRRFPRAPSIPRPHRQDPHDPAPPRARRFLRGRVLLQSHGQSRCVHGHVRPRRHQSRFRHRRRLHGFGPHDRDHRPGVFKIHRQDGVPGNRLLRHDAAGRETLLSRDERARPAAHLQRGLPPGPQRSPRPGRH